MEGGEGKSNAHSKNIVFPPVSQRDLRFKLVERLSEYISRINEGVILNCLPIITYYDKDQTLLGSRTFTAGIKLSNKETPLFI